MFRANALLPSWYSKCTFSYYSLRPRKGGKMFLRNFGISPFTDGADKSRLKVSISVSWINWKCNDVNNQQDATIFSLLIFLNLPCIFRATNSPILRSTYLLYIQLLVQCTDTARSVGALYQKLYTHSISAPEDEQICRPKHVGLI